MSCKSGDKKISSSGLRADDGLSTIEQPFNLRKLVSAHLRQKAQVTASRRSETTIIEGFLTATIDCARHESFPRTS
jgi:hypothetical protein